LRRLDQNHLVPLYGPISHLAYAVRSADVRTVILDGQVVLEHRSVLTIDESEVRYKVQGP
jgi:5-methylthioadenosine/S-adenosylhomocysteine deaminase